LRQAADFRELVHLIVPTMAACTVSVTLDDHRLAMVLSGEWHFGYGAKATGAAASALTQGAFYTEPANVPHFAFTGDQPVTVFITGTGPSDTHFEEDGP
jgi:uncharacterized RmlC-like cupin family protein